MFYEWAFYISAFCKGFMIFWGIWEYFCYRSCLLLGWMIKDASFQSVFLFSAQATCVLDEMAFFVAWHDGCEHSLHVSDPRGRVWWWLPVWIWELFEDLWPLHSALCLSCWCCFQCQQSKLLLHVPSQGCFLLILLSRFCSLFQPVFSSVPVIWGPAFVPLGCGTPRSRSESSCAVSC